MWAFLATFAKLSGVIYISRAA